MLDDLPESDLEQSLAAEEAALPALAPASPKPPLSNADAKDTAASVGVLVLNHTGELVLCGKRTDNGLIGGPGGNIQEGEPPAAAAMRETEEEFGITPLNLKRLGQITGFEGGKYGEPYIYVCTEYAGEPKASAEMRNPCFFPIDEFEPESVELFPPFAESLKFLDKVPTKMLTFKAEYGIIDNVDTIQTDGGEGSGRYPKGSGRHGDTWKQQADVTLLGTVTKDGVTVKSISKHSYARMSGRSISPQYAKKVISTGTPKPGNTPNTTEYHTAKNKAVVDKSNGNLVTIMWKDKYSKKFG